MTKHDTLHLVLTHHWFHETTKPIDPKRTEYRNMTERWMKIIYARRDSLKFIRFARGYTKTTATYAISHIDLGPCPLPGWEGTDRIRIHFEEIAGAPPLLTINPNTPGDDATMT